MAENTATLTWLIVIALSSLAQTIVLVGALVVVWRRVRAVEAKIHAVERDVIAPALARLELTLGDLQDAVGRFRRADETVRKWATRANDGVSLVVGTMDARVRPVIGLVKGVRAVARVWSRKRQARMDKQHEQAADLTNTGERTHV